MLIAAVMKSKECQSLIRFTCYNRYPDEKGTESLSASLGNAYHFSVTTVAPMKRGLKAFGDRDIAFARCVTTVAPMKRGLKANRRSDTN